MPGLNKPNLQTMNGYSNCPIDSGVYNSKCERKVELIGFNHSF